MIFSFTNQRSQTLAVEAMALIVTLGASTVCAAQSPLFRNPPAISPYRRIVTYNGVVCIATPNYDLMSNGQVIYKRQGMRFDGLGYFWSPSIPDKVVRRNHLETRIIGTANQYWPPLTSTSAPTLNQPRIARTPNSNPYFGTGTHTAIRNHEHRSANQTATSQSRVQIMRCPNGSYAIYCQ